MSKKVIGRNRLGQGDHRQISSGPFLIDRRYSTCIRAVAIVIAFCMTVPVVAQSSPTATMRAYYQAAGTRDFAAPKTLLSAEDLKDLAKAPVAPERIMAALTENVAPTMPEMRNEKIAVSLLP
jgi:hypothetical protein